MSNHRGSNNDLRLWNGQSISTLYVRPLEGELKREEIVSYFSAFGQVKNVKIRHKATNSYGFVTFSHAQSAVQAMEIDLHKIAGRRVEVCYANERNQDQNSLLNLDDKCISKILSTQSMSPLDLCSVAEANPRLKVIATQLFAQERGTWTFFSMVSNSGTEPAKRLLSNFGSLMSDMMIRGNVLNGKSTSIFELVSRHCRSNLIALCLDDLDVPEDFSAKLQPTFNNLKKLTISDCTFHGDTKKLFAHCESLVELDIFAVDFAFIIENTFPRLQQFKCHYPTDINLDSFIKRHPNLRRLEYWSYKDAGNASFLSLVSRNCTRLQELKCRVRGSTTLDLSSLVQLRKLNIYCGDRNISGAVKGLNELMSLESLKLVQTAIDPGFVETLSKLQQLKVLILKDSRGLQYLDQIGNMDRLTKLKVISSDYFCLEVDLLIQRLPNLQYLSVAVNRFKLKRAAFMKIVNALRARTNRPKLTFRLYGCDNYIYSDMQRSCFPNHGSIVEMRTEKCYFF